jgi:hypothetical protein
MKTMAEDNRDDYTAKRLMDDAARAIDAVLLDETARRKMRVEADTLDTMSAALKIASNHVVALYD